MSSEPTAYSKSPHSPYGQLMGTRILDSNRERRTVEIEYTAKPEFLNRIGTLAGGMISSMLDSVTGIVANEAIAADQAAVHAELSVHYHAPAKAGKLIGRGQIVSFEGRDVRSTGELFDAGGTHIASAEARLRVIRRVAPKAD